MTTLYSMRTVACMKKHLVCLAIFAGAFSQVSAEDSVTLHPEFPVVSGEYQLTDNWRITLPTEFNRRFEESELVIWRPGFTIWMSLWNNDHNETIDERVEWVRQKNDASAFDEMLNTEDALARYSYRLNESREEGIVYALYGFAFKQDGHIQVAFYFDDESDLEMAEALLSSIR